VGPFAKALGIKSMPCFHVYKNVRIKRRFIHFLGSMPFLLFFFFFFLYSPNNKSSSLLILQGGKFDQMTGNNPDGLRKMVVSAL